MPMSGNVPCVFPLCPDDGIAQSGRGGGGGIIGTEEFLFWHAVAHAANSSPRSPIKASGVYAGGNLALTAALTAPVGSADGERAFVLPLMLEIGISDQVAPGPVTLALAGTFIDGNAFTQTMELQPSGQGGTSRYIIVPTQVVQSAAYVCPLELNSGKYAVGGGVAYTLTPAAAPNDATTATPTNGERMPVTSVVCNISAAYNNTTFVFSALTPVSSWWSKFTKAYRAIYGGEQ